MLTNFTPRELSHRRRNAPVHAARQVANNDSKTHGALVQQAARRVRTAAREKRAAERAHARALAGEDGEDEDEDDPNDPPDRLSKRVDFCSSLTTVNPENRSHMCAEPRGCPSAVCARPTLTGVHAPTRALPSRAQCADSSMGTRTHPPFRVASCTRPRARYTPYAMLSVCLCLTPPVYILSCVQCVQGRKNV